MTYQYNPGDSYLSNFPNPFKIENIFLIANAFMLYGGGTYILWTAIPAIRAHQDKGGVISVLLGLSLIVFGTTYLIRALAQLRFFLGRAYPRGLVKEHINGSKHFSDDARELAETMRNRSLNFPEPKGPLNGVLYSVVRPLIAAPLPIQAAAVRHFHGVLAMCALLLSLFLSIGVYSGTTHGGLVSWLYLPLSLLAIASPFKLDRNADQIDDSTMMVWKLVALVIFAIMGPVLMVRFIPTIHLPEMWMIPLLLLIGAGVASVTFLTSLMFRMDNAPRTDVSCEQTMMSMNCHPAQLWTQISRDFQDNWVRNIPNRSYVNVLPAPVESQRGSFHGDIMEETQPLALFNMGFDSLRAAVGVQYVGFLVLIAAWSLFLTAASVCVASYWAHLFNNMGFLEICRILMAVVALNIAALMASRVGHFLWSRMYFKSRLIWISLEGTFQESELRIGNSFTGNAQSRAKLMRIEDATLRVWSAEIVSVAFGKDGRRFIMSMTGIDDLAKDTADRLKEFAFEQSSIVAPTSKRDLSKLQALSTINEMYRAGESAPLEESLHSRIGRSKNDMRESVEKLLPPTAGIVKFYDLEKQYGFISGDDGIDRFFSAKGLEGKPVSRGDRVRFTAAESNRGPKATHIEPLAY